MKRTYFTRLAALALTLILALSLTACGGKDTNTDGDNSGDTKTAVKIGVPNDTTNEARALLLLQENGIIKLADGAGITATKNDIVDNPYNVEIVEAEAAQLPNMLPDLDYAVINSNYAINAGLNPVNDSLFIEGSASAYANILAVKEGNENEPKILALKAALESKQVADYIAEKYAGSVVSVVENPTDGYDASVDYEALKGQTITIAASPTPRSWRWPRRSWPPRRSPWISRATTTMWYPTPWWMTAPWTPTTSSTCPIWRTSTPRTAPTSPPSPLSTWSPWVCTAASRPRWMR